MITFEHLIQQLKSADAAQRREAIIGLGKAGDPRALPHLAQIYKTDPDSSLRELAAKAGRHIHSQSKSTPQVPEPPKYVEPEPPPAYELYQPEEAEPDFEDIPPAPAAGLPDILAAYRKQEPPLSVVPQPESKPAAWVAALTTASSPEIDLSQAKPVSRQQRDRARQKLKNAFSFKTRNDDQNALAALAQALQLDPELIDDSSAQGLATALVGGAGKESIRVVLRRSQSEEGLQPTKAATFDVEALDVLISAIILFAVIVGFSIALIYGNLVLSQIAVPIMRNRPIPIAEVQAILAELPIARIMPFLIRSAAVTLGTSIFQILITYWIGNLFGGTGNLLRFLKVMMYFQVVLYILVGFALGAAILSIFSRSAQVVETAGVGAVVSLIFLFFIALGVQGFLASRIHRFNMLKGVASVIFADIIAGIIAGALGLFNALSR